MFGDNDVSGGVAQWSARGECCAADIAAECAKKAFGNRGFNQIPCSLARVLAPSGIWQAFQMGAAHHAPGCCKDCSVCVRLAVSRVAPQ
jgi:hypothetical protein